MMHFTLFLNRKFQSRRWAGVTLTELLIALGMLGLIATFAIPKVLQSQQDSRWNSIAKENVQAIAQALMQHEGAGLLSASTGMRDLTPYLNYVKIYTGTIDQHQNVAPGTTIDCSTASRTCLQMHNGAVMYIESHNNATFKNTASTNAIWFYLDPDGKVADPTGYHGRSALFFLYYNGNIRTYGTIFSNTYAHNNLYGSAVSNADPPWFSWD